jgi:hypothetical protein
MNLHATSQKERIEENASEPRLGETHWVQGNGYRYMGIWDKDGKWRCFTTGRELNVMVKILSD